MFSVDNFYDFFYSNYGWNKTKNLILVFQPHGSKDLHNLEPFGIDRETTLEIYKNSVQTKKIVMHDQEPLFLDHYDTYRHMIINQKKVTNTINEEQVKKAEQISSWAQDLTNLEIFKRAVAKKNTGLIICHSELNSKDIVALENNGFFSCYYWWHGMIARDWFRHWQHYDDLKIFNKANSKYRFLLYSRDHTGTREYRKKLVNYCRQYQKHVLYAWNKIYVDSSHSAKISVEDSQNSAIHIVAETLFDTDKIYLTEKIFKPMVMSQPFILFGPPRSLEYLRNYGFQTFGDFWDESYDLENDSDQRMSKLLGLIDDIASMSIKEFYDLYQRLLPVIEYNRQRFYSEKFQDDLILELRLNMERALLEQNQRHQHRLDDKSSTDGHDV